MKYFQFGNGCYMDMQGQGIVFFKPKQRRRGYKGMNIEDLEQVFEILPLAVIVSVFILTIVILEK